MSNLCVAYVLVYITLYFYSFYPYEYDDRDPYDLECVGEPPFPVQEESDPYHAEPLGRYWPPHNIQTNHAMNLDINLSSGNL